MYEIKSNESLADALKFTGGFSDSAFTDRLKVIQLTGREKNYKDVDASMFANYLPMQGDSIFAEKKEPVFDNKVTISGAVYRPGDYEFTKNISLKALIKKADGLRIDAFTNRATIKRLNNNRERLMLSVDRKSTRLNSSHIPLSRMPSSA